MQQAYSIDSSCAERNGEISYEHHPRLYFDSSALDFILFECHVCHIARERAVTRRSSSHRIECDHISLLNAFILFHFCSPSFAPTSVAMAFNRSALSRTRIYVRVASRATFRYIHEERRSHTKRSFALPLHQRNNLQTMWTADYANYRKVFFLQNLTLSDGSLLHETRASVLQTHFFPDSFIFLYTCNEERNKET